jgi:hypothetical protein
MFKYIRSRHGRRKPRGDTAERQVSDKPTSIYKILGLALVAGWGEGYFIIDGFQTDGRSERNEMDFRARSLQKQARLE